MLDYTYWQKSIRQRLDSEEIVWIQLVRNHYYILVGLREEISLLKIAEKYGFHVQDKVAWIFQRQGEVIVSKSKNRVSEDKLMLLGLTSGLKDIYFDDGDLAYFICPEHKRDEIDAILFLEDIQVQAKIVSYKPLEIIEVYHKEDYTVLYELLYELEHMPQCVDICMNFAFDEREMEKIIGKEDSESFN